MFNIRIYHIFAILVAIFINGSIVAKGHEVRVFGYVLDTDNRGVELANVYVEENTITGTTTNQNGYYELFVEIQDTVTLVYSMIGYETIRQQRGTTNQRGTAQ